MVEIVPILDQSPDVAAGAFHDYASVKACELAATGPGTSIDKYNGGTDSFIGSDTEITIGTMFKSFFMDDPKAYEAALPYVQSTFKSLEGRMDPERAYLNAVLAGAQIGEVQYFGSYVGDIRKMMGVAGDFIDDDTDERLSVAEFGSGAMCRQRAAVVHNTLKLFGVSSRLELGNLAHITEDGTANTEQHAFLTFENTRGERYILDPTNPIVHRNDDGQITWAKPAFYPLGLVAEGRQQVELKEYVAVDGEQEARIAATLVYTLDTNIEAA